jgi:hypothetical protein
MQKVLVYLLLAVSLGSCVTKGKYNAVVSAIESREKQQKRLEKQLQQLRETNEKLRDSAERIGG